MEKKPEVNKAVSDYFSELAKRSHKMKPRPKSFYKEMTKRSLISRGKWKGQVDK